MSTGPVFATGTFLWVLSAICQLHRRPFSPNLIAREFPPPHAIARFCETAAALGFGCATQAVHATRLGSLAVPFIAITKSRTDRGAGGVSVEEGVSGCV